MDNKIIDKFLNFIEKDVAPTIKKDCEARYEKVKKEKQKEYQICVKNFKKSKKFKNCQSSKSINDIFFNNYCRDYYFLSFF